MFNTGLCAEFSVFFNCILYGWKILATLDWNPLEILVLDYKEKFSHMLKNLSSITKLKLVHVKIFWNNVYHHFNHQNHSGFLYLDTKKCWLHIDLFTTFFLISLSSWPFSPEGSICGEILFRYVIIGAPGEVWRYLWFIWLAGSSFGMWIRWPVNLSWSLSW